MDYLIGDRPTWITKNRPSQRWIEARRFDEHIDAIGMISLPITQDMVIESFYSTPTAQYSKIKYLSTGDAYIIKSREGLIFRKDVNS